MERIAYARRWSLWLPSARRRLLLPLGLAEERSTACCNGCSPSLERPSLRRPSQRLSRYLVPLALGDCALLFEKLGNVGRLYDGTANEIIELSGERAHMFGRGEHQIHLAQVQRGS